ncbi:conserved Plasmodium protein, unknown function [Plasmodium ovale curtisi]|nr:conserved Plasmodium protein, unknown function [Plasmodium ovale curtisi]
MATFKNKYENSLNEKEQYACLESVLGRIFDELIFDFRRKFIQKISTVIDEVKHNDPILEIGKNRYNLKGGNKEVKEEGKEEDDEEVERKEKSLYNDSVLGEYLKRFTGSKKDNLIRNMQKEMEERERGEWKTGQLEKGERKAAVLTTGELFESLKFENDAKERMPFRHVLKGKNEDRCWLSKKESSFYDGKSELSNALERELNLKLDTHGEGNLASLSPSCEYKWIEKKKKNTSTDTSIKQFSISKKSNNNAIDLNTRCDDNKNVNKDFYSNIVSKYTVKRLFSNRSYSKEGDDLHHNYDEEQNKFHNSFVHRMGTHGEAHRLYSTTSNGEPHVERQVERQVERHGREKSSQRDETYSLKDSLMERAEIRPNLKSHNWSTHDRRSLENKDYKIVDKDCEKSSKKSINSKAGSSISELEHAPIVLKKEMNGRKNASTCYEQGGLLSNKCAAGVCRNDRCESGDEENGEMYRVREGREIGKQLFFEVVRGKRRRHLKGFECDDCKSFYNEIFSDSSDSVKLKEGGKKNKCKSNVDTVIKMGMNEHSRNGLHKKWKEDVYNRSVALYDDKNGPSSISGKNENDLVDNNLKKKHVRNAIQYRGRSFRNSSSDKHSDDYKNMDKYVRKCEFGERNNFRINGEEEELEEKFYEIEDEKVDEEQTKRKGKQEKEKKQEKAEKAEKAEKSEKNEGEEEENEETKEMKKKKIIQSFSRHRYHSKVNDSPQNFWSFDFFK